MARFAAPFPTTTSTLDNNLFPYTRATHRDVCPVSQVISQHSRQIFDWTRPAVVLWRHKLKLMLHEAIFRATCLATPLRNELHEPLKRVTPRAMAKIVVRQVEDIIAESKILFYFSQ
mgnify:CR=1 FL=1